MKYIIEHLEPRLYKWCFIEYSHISKIVGKNNLIFTNIKTDKMKNKLSKLGKVYQDSIVNLNDFKDKRICLLNADAEKTLDSKEHFDYLLFGGILGDNPPQKRTAAKLGSMHMPERTLGKKQMPTDVAVYVARKIVDGEQFNKMKFTDQLEIKIDKNESIILPFCYLIENGKPYVSEELVSFIKKRRFL